MKLYTEESYSPYCPICSGCGEEGCCSPLMCKQDENGSYCESYLKDLHFGYKMNRFFEGKIADRLPEELAKEYDSKWEEVYNEIYEPKHI